MAHEKFFLHKSTARPLGIIDSKRDIYSSPASFLLSPLFDICMGTLWLDFHKEDNQKEIIWVWLYRAPLLPCDLEMPYFGRSDWGGF